MFGNTERELRQVKPLTKFADKSFTLPDLPAVVAVRRVYADFWRKRLQIKLPRYTGP